MTEMAREDFRSFLQDERRVRQVYLKGRGFTHDGGSPDGADYYRTSDRRAIRQFVQYGRSRDEWRLYYAGEPDDVIFVLADGFDLDLQVFSELPEDNGPRYVASLNAMRDDLARQVRWWVRQYGQGVVGATVGGVISRLPANVTRGPAEVRDIVRALEHLDRRAFTFGEAGEAVYVTLVLRNARWQTFRLRPTRIEDVEKARRMKNPPLPPPIWRKLFERAARTEDHWPDPRR